MKYIKRVSKVKNDDTKGYIINSTNVVDKEKNTYSANVIDGLFSSLGNQEWENATLDGIYLTSGAITYKKIGKMVIVQFADIKVGKNIIDTAILATGLPIPKTGFAFLINGTNGGATPTVTNMRLKITSTGTLIPWYHNLNASSSLYYGQFIYFTS